jgi:hypothetical protein
MREGVQIVEVWCHNCIIESRIELNRRESHLSKVMVVLLAVLVMTSMAKAPQQSASQPKQNVTQARR